MYLVPEGETHPRGQTLLAELQYIHGIVRHNLALVTQAADAIAAGAPADQVQAWVRELAANNIVWRLRVNCMQVCRLIHAHHHHEDDLWFPVLTQVNPAIQAVVAKLQADHVRVAELLDVAEAAAERIVDDEAARPDLSAALRALGDHLLAHLADEEASLAPTLNRIQAWPLDAR